MLYFPSVIIYGLLPTLFYAVTHGSAIHRSTQAKHDVRNTDESFEAEAHRNLVYPGNFEKGSGWGNWTIDPDYYSPEGYGTYGIIHPGYKSKTAGYMNAYSFVGVPLYYPNITFKEGRQYHFSMYVNMTNPGACSLSVGHGYYDDILGIGGIYGQGSVVPNVWFSAEGYFVAGGTMGQIIIQYGCSFDATIGLTEFDNIKVVLC